MYRMGPTLAMTGIDSVLSLTTTQKELLRPRLVDLFAWHRRVELPAYAVAVEELRVRVQGGLRHDDLRWVRATGETLVRRLLQTVAPVAGELLAKLNQEQIDHLLSTGNDERRKREREGADVNQYVAKRTSEFAELAEQWVGPLLPAQRALVEGHLRNTFPDHRWREEREAERQAAFVTWLRQPRTAEAIAQRALVLATSTTAEEAEAPEARARLARIEAASDELGLALFRLATPAQRERLDTELRSLRDDLKELARE